MKDGMNKEEPGRSERVSAAHALFLKKKFVYLVEKTESAWKDYTEAYYAWIDAVCDDISAEHNQRVLARGGRCG